jgi:DnaJ-class molecular chaperone
MSNSPRDEDCPECSGSRIIRIEVGNAVRREFICGVCGGTGKRSDALARILSGESVKTMEFKSNQEEIRRMIAKVDRL